MIDFLFISYLVGYKVFLSLVDLYPRPDHTSAEYDLIQHFFLLLEEQRSFKNVLTLERL